MKCSKVIRVRGSQTPVPCGQCMLCRINKRRIWTTRLLLEAMPYGDRCSFLTLTYCERDLPRLRSGSSSLYPPDLTMGIKRLRKFYSNLRLRFYAVGEYGDDTWRPHYHALIFGLHPSQLRGVQHGTSGNNFQFSWWPFGFVNVGYSVGQEAVAYVAQYVTKKLTTGTDERLIAGQYPEFARMSRMGGGGIGSQTIASLVDIAKRFGFVPRQVRLAGRQWPIGRYLANRVSTLTGLPIQPYIEGVRYAAQMHNLQAVAFGLGTTAEQLLAESGAEAEKVLAARPSSSSRVL